MRKPRISLKPGLAIVMSLGVVLTAACSIDAESATAPAQTAPTSPPAAAVAQATSTQAPVSTPTQVGSSATPTAGPARPTASATAPPVTPTATATAESRVAAAAEVPEPLGEATGAASHESSPTVAANHQAPVIVLDPGHGGPETGAVNAAYGLVESEINLDIALRAAELLRGAGYEVVLTRETDRAVDPNYQGGGYRGGVAGDLQARVDTANSAQADLFLSVHNNGSGNPEQSGTEVWYNNQRAFSDRNVELAELALDSVATSLEDAGYFPVRRGVFEDSAFRFFQGQPYNIYVLGPGTSERRPHEPTHMPGVLIESLFVTNAADAAALSRPDFRQAIARGYLATVQEYFERFPGE